LTVRPLGNSGGLRLR